jgi:hypothetical protein
MTAIVELCPQTRADVLTVPAGTVVVQDGGFAVYRGSATAPVLQPVAGEFFGDLAFIVSDGLAAGDTVYYRRLGND